MSELSDIQKKRICSIVDTHLARLDDQYNTWEKETKKKRKRNITEDVNPIHFVPMKIKAKLPQF